MAKIVVARGEERYVARTMLAYRRPGWVRGELYDGVGSLRASFLLEGGVLSVRLADSNEVLSDVPEWSGWDEILGIPSGASRLFGFLPLVLDPWAMAGSEHPPSQGITTTIDGGRVVTIRYAGVRVTELTVSYQGDTETVCTFEGGDGCLPATTFTVELPQHGVVVWITVEADADFPESVPTKLLPEK